MMFIVVYTFIPKRGNYRIWNISRVFFGDFSGGNINNIIDNLDELIDLSIQEDFLEGVLLIDLIRTK